MKKIYLPMDETVEFIFHQPSTGQRIHAVGNFTAVDLERDYLDFDFHNYPYQASSGSWGLKLEAAIRRINVFRG